MDDASSSDGELSRILNGTGERAERKMQLYFLRVYGEIKKLPRNLTGDYRTSPGEYSRNYIRARLTEIIYVFRIENQGRDVSSQNVTNEDRLYELCATKRNTMSRNFK